MKNYLISGFSSVLLFGLAALPALADTSGVGSTYLMSHTWLDPQKNVQNKNGGNANKKSLAQATGTDPAQKPDDAAPVANSQEFPTQILKTGVRLNAVGLSANSLQLCENIGLSPTLERISTLRDSVNGQQSSGVETLNLRHDLREATQKARLLIHKTSLEIDATEAQIQAEKDLYNEILTTFKGDRDKAIAKTNAFAFISNGVLWAVTEAFVIPCYKYPVYNVPAGIVGIPAGVLPSLASMYVFKQMSGKKRTSDESPNMLAKLFDYPVNPEIDYPRSVWTFLNQVPAETPGSKTRLDQIKDRWIADANMPAFTDRHSKKQLDVITASVAHKKALTIDTLTARYVMLDQLNSEIAKMKRMLLELDLVVLGDKRFVATRDTQQLQ